MEIPDALAAKIWVMIKDARDEVALLRAREDRLHNLLSEMKTAGMAAHLPTIDEVIADGPYELLGRK